MSTPEEIAQWTTAIEEIMDRDGVTEEEANVNLTNLLHNEEVRLAAEAEVEPAPPVVAEPTPEEVWTACIVEIMARDGISEEEANTNFTNLLHNLANPE